MIFRDLSFVPLILLVVCSTVIIVQISWRQMMIVLGVQYLAAFWLVALSWPLGLGLVKLIVGVVVCVVLGASLGAAQESVAGQEGLRGNRSAILPARLFRGFTALLGLIVVFSLAPGMQVWLPKAAGLDVVRGGMVLVVAGLVQLGMTTLPGQSAVGLLTLLSGFEILYASLESSVLVAGLLAVINLGLALVATYAIAMSTAPAPGGEERGK